MSIIVDEEAQRPWGYYEVLLDTPYTKVKEITVEPGHRLSYQSHKHREEYWTCVAGELTVVLDDKELYITLWSFDTYSIRFLNTECGIKEKMT